LGIERDNTNLKVESIVNGVNFKRFCDVVIDVDTVNDPRNYRVGDIVFCKTDYLGVFYDEVRGFDGKLKLVSHQSDYPVGEMLWRYKPDCIVKWFAQNVNYQHPDLIPIPIGIENHFGPSKGSLIDVEFIESSFPLMTTERINKIYCNFKNTHPNRGNVRNILRTHEYSFIQDGDLSSADYHREMSKYLFVASPRGNGIDCHRTWEALLVGSIPIVERHFMFDAYPTLPIIQIDDWREVLGSKFLENKANEVLSKRLDFAPLCMKYWEEKLYGND
jgi:hypothetical protein